MVYGLLRTVRRWLLECDGVSGGGYIGGEQRHRKESVPLRNRVIREKHTHRWIPSKENHWIYSLAYPYALHTNPSTTTTIHPQLQPQPLESIKDVLIAYSKAAFIPDPFENLPLHLSLRSEKTWVTGVKEIFESASHAIYVRDRQTSNFSQFTTLEWYFTRKKSHPTLSSRVPTILYGYDQRTHKYCECQI